MCCLLILWLSIDFEIVLSGTGATENRQALWLITTNQQDLISIVAELLQIITLKRSNHDQSNSITNIHTKGLIILLVWLIWPLIAILTMCPNSLWNTLQSLAAFDGFY